MSAGTCANPLCDIRVKLTAGLWCSPECRQEDFEIANMRGISAQRRTLQLRSRMFEYDHAAPERREPQTTKPEPESQEADPEPPQVMEPLTRATPRRPRSKITVVRSSEGTEYVYLRTGDRCTAEFMTLVVQGYICGKLLPAEIADKHGVRTEFVRAILAHNRVPLVRNGRGRRPARNAS